MKKNIAIVTGGNSSESVISLQSASTIKEVLNDEKYNAWVVNITGNDWEVCFNESCNLIINKDDFSFTHEGEKTNFDCALMSIHGTPGEDGKLQAYFDLVNIPHTTCNVLAASITFNKFASKTYLKNFGIDMANSIMIRKGQKIKPEDIISITGLPCFVKPNEGGSSFGTSKVKYKADLKNAIISAFKEDADEVIIEEFIVGTVITCGLVKTKEDEYIFPVTEIVSKTEFFDYDAKYTPELVEEITPARIPDNIAEKCQESSSFIYDILNCHGLIRVDYILKGDKLYFLEVNTVPGMSAASIVPKQAEVFGLSLTELFDIILEDSMI